MVHRTPGADQLGLNVTGVTVVNELSRARLVDPRGAGAGLIRADGDHAEWAWGQAVWTSLRSPDHSVWKTPSLSTRLYVCAPKKSR